MLNVKSKIGNDEYNKKFPSFGNSFYLVIKRQRLIRYGLLFIIVNLGNKIIQFIRLGRIYINYSDPLINIIKQINTKLIIIIAIRQDFN
jgi:hypothetical protein